VVLTEDDGVADGVGVDLTSKSQAPTGGFDGVDKSRVGLGSVPVEITKALGEDVLSGLPLPGRSIESPPSGRIELILGSESLLSQHRSSGGTAYELGIEGPASRGGAQVQAVQASGQPGDVGADKHHDSHDSHHPRHAKMVAAVDQLGMTTPGLASIAVA
jgi:hypothetical protein